MRIKHKGLPADCTTCYDAFMDHTHILFHGRYVVSMSTGRKKFVKGNDAVAQKRARLFAWKFQWNVVEGYRLELEEETK